MKTMKTLNKTGQKTKTQKKEIQAETSPNSHQYNRLRTSNPSYQHLTTRHVIAEEYTEETGAHEMDENELAEIMNEPNPHKVVEKLKKK